MDLQGKNIVVTGSTGGIGREVVKLLDSENVNLILLSKSAEELETLSHELKNTPALFPCDFAVPSETENTVKEISKKFQKIDALINAAGIGIYKPVDEATLEEWNDSMNINVSSQFILIMRLIKNLKKSHNSVVINIGSGAGVIPMEGRSIYCATKFAVRGLTLSLAEEYRGTSIDFCLITLGSVLTSFGPMSLAEKKSDMERGKKTYFTPNWVAKKLVSIVKGEDRRTEYTLFPSDYVTEWKSR